MENVRVGEKGKRQDQNQGTQCTPLTRKTLGINTLTPLQMKPANVCGFGKKGTKVGNARKTGGAKKEQIHRQREAFSELQSLHNHG